MCYGNQTRGKQWILGQGIVFNTTQIMMIGMMIMMLIMAVIMRRRRRGKLLNC
jgi:hypothetical protein